VHKSQELTEASLVSDERELRKRVGVAPFATGIEALATVFTGRTI
jgi:hypothetical protein